MFGEGLQIFTLGKNIPDKNDKCSVHIPLDMRNSDLPLTNSQPIRACPEDWGVWSVEKVQ